MKKFLLVIVSIFILSGPVFAWWGTGGVLYTNDLKVGIGTKAPNYPLHLHVPTTSAVSFQITHTNTGVTAADGTLLGVDGALSAFIRNQNNADIKLYTNDIERMRIKNDGKVGIGTTNPSGTLHVSGNVIISAANQSGAGILNNQNKFINISDLSGLSIGMDGGNSASYIDTDLDASTGSPIFVIDHDGVDDSNDKEKNYIILKNSYNEAFSWDNNLTNYTSSYNFGLIKNSGAELGGLEIIGLGDGLGLKLTGYGAGTISTTNTSIGVIHLMASGKASESPTRDSADANIITFANYDLTRMMLKGDGRLYVDNAVFSSGYDFAEYFESKNKIRTGYAIGLNYKTGLVREYKKNDILIGIQSISPGFVGNCNNKLLGDKVLVGLVGQFNIPENSIELNNIIFTKDRKYIIGYKLKNGNMVLKIEKFN